MGATCGVLAWAHPLRDGASAAPGLLLLRRLHHAAIGHTRAAVDPVDAPRVHGENDWRGPRPAGRAAANLLLARGSAAVRSHLARRAGGGARSVASRVG